MGIKVIFFDRDGVINEEIGYLHKSEDFIFIDKNFISFHYLKNLGYSFIIVSNQSGIGRGKYSINDYFSLNSWMLKEFQKNNIDILDTFFCPHAPENNCSCRKPKTGMFDEAMKKYPIDKENSWMVGDKETDIIAAQKFGIKNTILVRSGHAIKEESSSAKHIMDSILDIDSIVN